MSVYLELLIAVGAVAILAWVATGIARRHSLRKGMLDVPNARSSHSAPTARGGGIAIAAVYAASITVLAMSGRLRWDLTLAILAAAGMVAVIGYADDRKALPPALRFGVHIVAALLVVSAFGGVPEQSMGSIGLHGIVAGYVLGVLGLTWATNLFNFMDGIDGIAAVETIFVAGAGSWLNWRFGTAPDLTLPLIFLAAATAGFLIWNWPPARIFMGDVGSGFLGFMVACLGLACSQNHGVPIETWVILAGAFIVDATVTLIRRIVRGEPWAQAHRSHAYQRLASHWRAHRPVTLLVAAVNVLWLLPWAVAATAHARHALICMISALGPLVLAVLALGAGAKSETAEV